jgi:hypothetical protein
MKTKSVKQLHITEYHTSPQTGMDFLLHDLNNIMDHKDIQTKDSIFEKWHEIVMGAKL